MSKSKSNTKSKSTTEVNHKYDHDGSTRIFINEISEVRRALMQSTAAEQHLRTVVHTITGLLFKAEEVKEMNGKVPFTKLIERVSHLALVYQASLPKSADQVLSEANERSWTPVAGSRVPTGGL